MISIKIVSHIVNTISNATQFQPCVHCTVLAWLSLDTFMSVAVSTLTSSVQCHCKATSVCRESCNTIGQFSVCAVPLEALTAVRVSLAESWVQCHAQPPSCPVAWITLMQILMIHFLVLLGTTGLPKMDEFTLDVQIPFFLLHFYVPMSTLMQLSRELLNCKGKFIFISHDWDSGIN